LAEYILPTTVYGGVRKTWQVARAFYNMRTFLRSRSGVVARLVRHPKPMSAPWRRNSLDVGRSGSMGDVLMCTPALRELKLKNRTSYVRFYTNYPTLVRGLPYIDEVLAPDDRPKEVINLQYEDVIPPRAHLAKVIGDNLGLNVRNVRPDCMIEPGVVQRFRESWRILSRPHIVVQRLASSWTPNKNWPEKYWVELIEILSQQAGVIEIGSEMSEQKISLGNYIDLRGQTSLEELVAVIAAADVLVGPVSGPVHVAAAAGIPVVEIIGGYEHPINTSYIGNISLYTALPCAPCWLRESCPYDLKCLKTIKPETVESAVWNVLGNRKPAS
jgi:ADP-heptose:LPS heptosyltransferase